MTGAGFDDWWRAYDAAGLEEDSHPTQELAPVLESCDLIVTSDLRRARETLERALPGTRAEADALFREAPIPGVPLPLLRMPAAPWRVVGRISWLAGYAGTVEPARETYRRAAMAADRLGEWSASHAHVGVVAHGFFNYLVAAALRKRGWDGGSIAGTPGHWSHTTLRRG